MQLDVTIRQKLVRVFSGAAICGLSLSFIIGEAVDAKAKQIHSWALDPSILPTAFLPLKPSQGALARITIESLGRKLVSLNSFPVIDSKDAVASAGNNAIFQDSLRIILAAPIAQEPEAKVAKPEPKPTKDPIVKAVAPVKAKAVADVVIEAQPERLPIQDVERVLLSIHDTTAALTKPAAKRLEETGAVNVGGIVVKALPEEGAKATAREVVAKAETKRVISSDEVIVGDPEAETGPTSAAALLATTDEGSVQAGEGWLIRGRLVAEGKTEPGHFEVGLFSKIDQDGVPVGFPIVQQILPAGKKEFTLKVPGKLERGFLYGEFVATKSGKRTWIAPPVNPWQRHDRQFAELVMPVEDKVSTVAAASAFVASERKETLLIKGTVGTQFSSKTILQEDVVVKVRGRKESARTDKNGAFRLEIPQVAGTVFLEFLKAGYHPSLVAVPSSENGRVVNVEIASRDAVDQIARRMGVRQITTKGVFFGKVAGGEGEALKGLSLSMNTKADGPFYFGENGVPMSGLKSTTADGRFIFFNVEPGTGFVDSNLNGEPIAPFVLSTVEGGEFVAKTLRPASGSIKGRLFNPVSTQGHLSPVAGARLRIEGSSDWSNTDSYGAFSIGPLKWMKGERVSIEFSASKYNNHRYLMTPDEKKDSLNLFAFPANYLARLGASMDVDIDPYAGIVMGKVSGLSVRIDAMADHSAVNSARDFYFDSRGKLRGSHSMTDPRFGTYVIFNVPKGRTLLQGNDGNGVLRYSDSVISSPASISIIMD